MWYDKRRSREHALLAQLDRVTGYEPVGQGFESLTTRQEDTHRVSSFFLTPDQIVNSL